MNNDLGGNCGDANIIDDGSMDENSSAVHSIGSICRNVFVDAGIARAWKRRASR